MSWICYEDNLLLGGFGMSRFWYWVGFGIRRRGFGAKNLYFHYIASTDFV
jgi:hypothetical protein